MMPIPSKWNIGPTNTLWSSNLQVDRWMEGAKQQLVSSIKAVTSKRISKLSNLWEGLVAILPYQGYCKELAMHCKKLHWWIISVLNFCLSEPPLHQPGPRLQNSLWFSFVSSFLGGLRLWSRIHHCIHHGFSQSLLPGVPWRIAVRQNSILQGATLSGQCLSQLLVVFLANLDGHSLWSDLLIGQLIPAVGIVEDFLIQGHDDKPIW